MKELIKSFFVYGLTSGLSKFISLLLVPIYTRYFNPSEYGTIDIIQSVINISMIFGVLQIETSIQRYYYELEGEERKNYGSTVFWSVTMLSVFLMLVLFIFSESLSLLMFNTPIYSNVIKLSSITIPLANMSVISFIIIRYMKKPILFGVITFLQFVFSASSTIVFVLIFDMGILSVFYGQILGLFIVNIMQLYILRNFYKFFWDYNILKKMLAFALPQFPARLGSTSNVYLNRFFMLGMLSTYDIGLFSVGVRFASIMGLVLSSFSMAWIPFMYETLNKNNHKEIFSNIFNHVCILVLLLVSGLSFFSKEIIYIFTSPKYYDAHYLLGGLVLYNGLFIIKEFVDLGPKITKKTVFITYIYIISSIVNLVLLYIGIKLFNIYGVIISLVGTNLILVMLSWYFSNKLYPISYNKIYFSVIFVIMVLIVFFNVAFDLNLYIKMFIYLFIFSFVFVKEKLFLYFV